MEIIQAVFIAVLYILLFVVVIILLALFFPLKIRFKALAENNIFVKATVSWLFRVIYMTYTLQNNNSVSKLYVIGIPIDLDKYEKKDKIVVKKNKKEKSNKIKEKLNLNSIIEKISFKRTVKVIKKHFSYIQSIKNSIIREYKKVRNKVKQFSDYKYKREAMHYTFNMIKNLFAGIKFKKADIFLNFGFEDPCYTGNVNGILSIITPFLPLNLKYNADFEKKIFECNSEITAYTTIWKIGFPILSYILKIKSLEDEK